MTIPSSISILALLFSPSILALSFPPSILPSAIPLPPLGLLLGRLGRSDLQRDKRRRGVIGGGRLDALPGEGAGGLLRAVGLREAEDGAAEQLEAVRGEGEDARGAAAAREQPELGADEVLGEEVGEGAVLEEAEDAEGRLGGREEQEAVLGGGEVLVLALAGLGDVEEGLHLHDEGALQGPGGAGGGGERGLGEGGERGVGEAAQVGAQEQLEQRGGRGGRGGRGALLQRGEDGGGDGGEVLGGDGGELLCDLGRREEVEADVLQLGGERCELSDKRRGVSEGLRGLRLFTGS